MNPYDHPEPIKITVIVDSYASINLIDCSGNRLLPSDITVTGYHDYMSGANTVDVTLPVSGALLEIHAGNERDYTSTVEGFSPAFLRGTVKSAGTHAVLARTDESWFVERIVTIGPSPSGSPANPPPPPSPPTGCPQAEIRARGYQRVTHTLLEPSGIYPSPWGDLTQFPDPQAKLIWNVGPIGSSVPIATQGKPS